MANIQTHFGEIDAEGLDAFKNSFDAREILEAVEKIETIRNEMKATSKRLLRLHRMTQCLTKGIEVVSATPNEKPELIWVLAEEIAKSMQDWPDEIDGVCRTLTEFEQLVPGVGNDFPHRGLIPDGANVTTYP
jgi:hypothetical protein